MKTASLIALTLLSINTSADSVNHVGKVKEIVFFAKNWTSYSNTDETVAAIYMDPTLPKACGTGDYRVIIDSKHAAYNSVVSAALAAKLSETTVHLTYLDTCNVRSNSWDFGYLHLK